MTLVVATSEGQSVRHGDPDLISQLLLDGLPLSCVQIFMVPRGQCLRQYLFLWFMTKYIHAKQMTFVSASAYFVFSAIVIKF